jgi:hypothetical protein
LTDQLNIADRAMAQRLTVRVVFAMPLQQQGHDR